MVRGVVFPYTRGGVVAAVLLGMGRAVGEAIAVTQVIGGFTGISWSLFGPGDTLASRIAAQYQGAVSNIHIASIVYLAVILLAFALVTNVGRAADRRPFRASEAGAPDGRSAGAALGRRPGQRRKLVNRLAEGSGSFARASLSPCSGSCDLGVRQGRCRRSTGISSPSAGTFGETGGGIAPAFVGAVLVGLATRRAPGRRAVAST